MGRFRILENVKAKEAAVANILNTELACGVHVADDESAAANMIAVPRRGRRLAAPLRAQMREDLARRNRRSTKSAQCVSFG